MRRPLVLSALCAAFLAAPHAAQAHGTTWYWTRSLSESNLQDRYSGIISATCLGIGASSRTRSGKLGYKHFDCYVEFDDGDTGSGKFHVTGRYNFRFYWRD
jgi:hypothetical protein